MASNQAPVVDRIRIIPRGQEFLNRNVGASGEVFYNRETSSLRLYNGKDRGGREVVTYDSSGVLDVTSAKNKIRAEWPDLATLTSEVSATDYQGMVAYAQSEGILYYAHNDLWNPIAGGGASVDVGLSPPEEPEVGNIWFNSNNGKLYVYIQDADTSQWVQPATPAISAFSSITLNDSTQMSASGSDTINFVDGPGIEISNDSTNNTIIISATGGVGIAEGGDVTFDSVTANQFINTGVGSPVLTSASTITLTAPDGITINGDLDVTGTVTGLTLTATDVGLGNVTNESKATMFTSPTFTGTATLQQTTEVLNTKTGATGTVAHDFSTGGVFYHSTIAADFTANFTNVPTTDDRTISVVLILSQGTTAYVPTALQIDGAAQTINWQSGVAPGGTANGVDIISFSLIRTGGTWTVLGSGTSYS
jgi:hypothetical protein